MIPALLLAMMADLVFDSVGRMRQAYEAEIDRYLRERGIARPRPAKPIR